MTDKKANQPGKLNWRNPAIYAGGLIIVIVLTIRFFASPIFSIGKGISDLIDYVDAPKLNDQISDWDTNKQGHLFLNRYLGGYPLESWIQNCADVDCLPEIFLKRDSEYRIAPFDRTSELQSYFNACTKYNRAETNINLRTFLTDKGELKSLSERFQKTDLELLSICESYLKLRPDPDLLICLDHEINIFEPYGRFQFKDGESPFVVLMDLHNCHGDELLDVFEH